jgi:hypothetical protein
MRGRKHGIWALFLLGSCSMGADKYGEATDEGTLGRRQSALDQGCANVTPVAIYERTFDHLSPHTYSQVGCYKAQVIQSPSGTAGASSIPPSHDPTTVRLRWADTMPTTQSACTNAWLGGYRFRSIVGGYETADFQTATGTWSNGQCTLPAINFLNVNDTGTLGSRYAVTARAAPTTAAATRSFRLTTLINP